MRESQRVLKEAGPIAGVTSLSLATLTLSGEQSSCVHFHFHLTLTPSPVLIIILTLNRITAIQRTHLWQVCKAPAR